MLELTGSGTALGTVVAMQFLPTLLLAPFGGVIADRFDKRKLIIITQSTAGLLALSLGVLTITGAVELWMVYVIAAGFGAVTALDNPSRQTFVMEMVGPADIANAVTLNSVVVNAARAIGPAIGGVIIATAGVGPCFIFNAVSYVAVIIAMLLIRTAELHPSARTPRAPGQLRDGFRYAWNTPILRTTLVMLVLIGTLTYEFTTTLPLLSEFTFGAGSSGLAAMTALMGAGAVIGGLVVAASGPPTMRRLVNIAAAFGAHGDHRRRDAHDRAGVRDDADRRRGQRGDDLAVERHAAAQLRPEAARPRDGAVLDGADRFEPDRWAARRLDRRAFERPRVAPDRWDRGRRRRGVRVAVDPAAGASSFRPPPTVVEQLGREALTA